MATLTVRRLDDDVYQQLKQKARMNGRSLEAEARTVLTRSATEPAEKVGAPDAWIARVLEGQARMKAKYGELPDSTELIRQMRDEE